MHYLCMIIRFTTVTTIILTLAGCGGGGGSNGTMTMKTDENIKPGTPYWRHGNFCGKGHPDVSNIKLKGDRINALFRQPAIDNIDTACKYHDICYEITDGPDATCDMLLEMNISIISMDRDPEYGKLSFECFNVITEVSNLFEGKRVSNYNFGAQSTIVLMSPFIIASKIMMGGLLVLDKCFQWVSPQPGLARGCSLSYNPRFIAPISRTEFDRTKQCLDNYQYLLSDTANEKERDYMQSQFRRKYGKNWEKESVRRLGCIDTPIRTD